MKKILSFSSSKILLACALGVVVTLGAFWHHQVNQTQLDRMNVLNQGVGTCFNRISQTFTALMIKDIQSPYLNRGFMGLSDECLNETIKGINPFRQNVGRGYETLNKLISEVNWFHERALKIHAPMQAGQNLNAPLTPLSDAFTKMEALKVNLVDEIDANNAKIREVQTSDEFLMGSGLIIFVISLSLLSLKEFNRRELQKEIEKQAINHLQAGQAHVGAIVDQLVEKALTLQGMTVTAQIFKDYHGELLERFADKKFTSTEKIEKIVPPQIQKIGLQEDKTDGINRTSLKEVLVSIQNVHSKNLIDVNEVRDVLLNIDFENFEQILNAAVHKLSERRSDNKKIFITNQIHSDRTVISLFLAGATFTAPELEFANHNRSIVGDTVDTNMIILSEMVSEAKIQWHVENKTDRQGHIMGMNTRFIIKRAPKDSRAKNLISIVRGKKKDIAQLMN